MGLGLVPMPLSIVEFIMKRTDLALVHYLVSLPWDHLLHLKHVFASVVFVSCLLSSDLVGELGRIRRTKRLLVSWHLELNWRLWYLVLLSHTVPLGFQFPFENEVVGFIVLVLDCHPLVRLGSSRAHSL